MSQVLFFLIFLIDGKDLYPYKVQATQELKLRDHGLRSIYADCVLEQQNVDANFSDKAHYLLSGYVNKLNCRSRGVKHTCDTKCVPKKLL